MTHGFYLINSDSGQYYQSINSANDYNGDNFSNARANFAQRCFNNDCQYWGIKVSGSWDGHRSLIEVNSLVTTLKTSRSSGFMTI